MLREMLKGCAMLLQPLEWFGGRPSKTWRFSKLLTGRRGTSHPAAL